MENIGISGHFCQNKNGGLWLYDKLKNLPGELSSELKCGWYLVGEST
jgi:hypothetical protein